MRLSFRLDLMLLHARLAAPDAQRSAATALDPNSQRSFSKLGIGVPEGGFAIAEARDLLHILSSEIEPTCPCKGHFCPAPPLSSGRKPKFALARSFACRPRASVIARLLSRMRTLPCCAVVFFPSALEYVRDVGHLNEPVHFGGAANPMPPIRWIHGSGTPYAHL
jgi:hypothetical protein